MKTADRENPNSRAWLCNKPSPWGGRQEIPSLKQAGWEVRNFPAEGGSVFLDFSFYRTSWKQFGQSCVKLHANQSQAAVTLLM
jgi:hypothetical protein